MSSSLSLPQADNSDAAARYQEVYAAALRLLVRREHSAQELRHKLKTRGCPRALVDQVVIVLTDEGTLSDGRFADIYARGRFERGFGPLRIEAELRERGVAQALIEAALADYAAYWRDSACRQRHKRFGRQAPREFGERARQMRFLQQRGFSGEQIRAALDDAVEADL